MARHYNKAREKKIHKMTRHGIIEQNAVTGEIENISQRGQDLNLRTGQQGEQPIQLGRTNYGSFSNQPQQPDKQKNEQQRRYNQFALESENRINDTPDKAEVTTPSADGINGHENGNTATEAPTVDESRLSDNAGNEPTPEMRIHDKPILTRKTDDLPEKEKYVSLLETADSESDQQEKSADHNKRPDTAETPDKKGRLRFSKEEKKPGQADGAARLEADTALRMSAPEAALSFEPDKTDKLQFNKNNKAEKGTAKRKRNNKRQNSDKYRKENDNPEQASTQSENPQDISDKSGLSLVEEAQNRQQSGSTSKLQFNKESKLSDTPERAKPQKMSRKRKKRMKAEAARTERKLAQTPPELAVAPVFTDIPQPEKSPATIDATPEKSSARIKENESKLQERPGKLQYDNTEQGKFNRTPNQTKKQRLNDTISDKTQPKQGNPDTEKPSSGDGRETANNPVKSSKLQFATDETTAKTDTKLTELSKKADYYNTELAKAQNKLASAKKSKKVRAFGEKKGKAKTKFSFENEILPPGARKSAPTPIELTRKGTGDLTRMGAGKLHHKVYEVEDENVGIQAGHLGERALESGYRGSKRITRSTFRYFRNKPYRTAEKLEKKALRANIKYSYRKALAENPKLKSSIVSRFMQKRRIKQQYAKAARDAKRAGKAIKKTGDITAKTTKAIVGIVKSHPVATAIVLLVLLLVFFMSSLFSAMSGLAGTGMTAIVASSYLAEDGEIDAAELNYTEWETDLLMQINRAEQDYPGYDEYRYEVDNIGHNPYELMAFLTAKYQVYEYADIQTVLQEIFNQQYTLSVTQSVETRYYEGEDDELILYDWNVLTVSLTSRSFTDVIMPLMDTEQTAIYSLLIQTKGNRQYVDSPFDFNWLPNVSSNYGYRIHPITGAKDYHMGVDIAVPVGTDIKAGFDGTVTFAGYSGDYGYVVIIKNDKGVEAKYAHCDSLLVSAGQEIKRGDVIAKSGNSGASTGPHLHMEVVKDGQYLNPLYFSVTNDIGLTTPEYGYAGLPMGDGSYAALIEEAEKHLGKRYVFGSNGPNTFDCSSFVSWTLNQSGVASFGRTTAQGLYNLCTPVSPSDARPGDLIFFHSTYSTTNTVTHVGIYVGSGYMIHAGDPVQYASINSSYFQSHFYAFGRLN